MKYIEYLTSEALSNLIADHIYILLFKLLCYEAPDLCGLGKDKIVGTRVYFYFIIFKSSNKLT